VTTEGYCCQEFGIPFLIVVKRGDNLEAAKKKIQQRLSIPDAEFQKWKFALPPRWYLHITDDTVLSQAWSSHTEALYMDHPNNTPRFRYKRAEKAIKFNIETNTPSAAPNNTTSTTTQQTPQTKP